jgi:hypothetical protein
MLGVIPLVMLFYYVSLEVHTNIYGIPQTVTVSFHKDLVMGGGRSPIAVSWGYYYVKRKRYTAHAGEKLPIGTKFEIKYSPIIPSEYNVIRIIQE